MLDGDTSLTIMVCVLFVCLTYLCAGGHLDGIGHWIIQ